MYISEREGTNFWLSVLTYIKSCRAKDIWIGCTDNLAGFSEAILTIFPQAEVQTCVIHQIRNSLKYVASKDQKAFMKDLKMVYQATIKSQTEDGLINPEEIWGKKYPVVIRSLNNNRDRLSTYFHYDEYVRRFISTTIGVEGSPPKVHKVIKTKRGIPQRYGTNETDLPFR